MFLYGRIERGSLMAKNRIAMFLLSTVLTTTPLLKIEAMQVNSKPEQLTESDKNLDLRNYKVKQVEELIKVEFQKRKEIEARKLEEQKKIEEEQKIKEPNFNPYDVTELSNLNKEQIYQMLEGTELITLVDAFYWYEQEYNVNLIFIASIVALESSWGRSSLAISHNNLTGYIGRSGQYYSFNNWGESLEETFRLIGDEYTKEEGLFYNGKSVWDINQKYCELSSWTDKVITIGNELISKIN